MRERELLSINMTIPTGPPYRTASGSAVSAAHTSPAASSHLVLFGAGLQASVHALAICAVRPIVSITIVNRSIDRASALAACLVGDVKGELFWGVVAVIFQAIISPRNAWLNFK